jgi:chaperone protein EcpD
MATFKHTLALAAIAVAGMDSAQAGMTIHGTRVVYPGESKEVSLSMTNDGSTPRLVQVWIDDGDPAARPRTTRAPFVVTPPMGRVDPGKGQTIRIIFKGGDIAPDREHVFWLNVLEVPPKPKARVGDEASHNIMQVAVRSRIKLFYRPTGLRGSPADAIKMLTWRVEKTSAGYEAICSNDTAFNASFTDIRFKGSQPQRAASKGGMCPAKGKARLPISGEPSGNEALVATAINDYGGLVPHDFTYSR